MVLAWLVVVFITLPIVELAVLFRVHEYMGFFPTLGLVITTGFVGAVLARAQGLMLLMAIRRELAEGRMPAPHLLDGVMILVAGALLVTPGLLTDTAGFLLLVPAVRAAVRRWLRARIEHKLRFDSGTTTLWRW